MTIQQGVWAAKRLAFQGYMGACLVTVVGGWITAPLLTYCMYGDWRFWLYFRPGARLFVHVYKMFLLMARRENGGFLLSVPLTSPPLSSPDRNVVQLNGSWEHGSSCGSCTRCCDKIDCPILDPDSGLCNGHDSFFWRYFNCGRYPSRQSEIDYYGCPKWSMLPVPALPKAARTGTPAPAAPAPSGTGALSLD